jgi:hypothetical protein
MFRKNRPWQRFHSAPCKRRFRYLAERRRSRTKRNGGTHNAGGPHFERVRCRRFIEPGQIKKALELLARTRPEILSKMLASVPAAETPARARIELAG